MFLKFEGLSQAGTYQTKLSAMFVGLLNRKMAYIWMVVVRKECRAGVYGSELVSRCVAIHSLAREAVALRNTLSHSGKYRAQ